MDNDDLVNYWTNCSDEDYDTMLYLFEGNRYTYSLFFGHLSIEKLLKALYAASAADDNHVIKSHNLLLLAQKCGLELSDEQVEKLQTITQFNISARYDDYKRSFSLLIAMGQNLTKSHALGSLNRGRCVEIT